jgi:hypothetical protein
MFRSGLASVSLAALVSTAALAQSVPLPLISTPVSRTVYLSLDAVQTQVDASVRHAAASRDMITVALAQAPLAPLVSTPILRR